MAQDEALERFIARWLANEGGAERANFPLFLTELCALIDLRNPSQAQPAIIATTMSSNAPSPSTTRWANRATGASTSTSAQGLKAEPRIAATLAALVRLGHAAVEDGRYTLRRAA